MLKIKRVVFFTIAAFLIVISLTRINGINKLYGNDEQSIEKVIKSIEAYENQTIKIIEIKDIYDDRIVGFLADNNPAYIHFSKNQKGDYEWTEWTKSVGSPLALFLINVKNEKANEIKFMAVTTEKNEIAKLLLDVNGKIIEKDFSVKQNSVTWIDLPEGQTHSYKYKYFDKEGNEIIN